MLPNVDKKKQAFINRQRAAFVNCKKSTGPKDCSVVRFNPLRHGLRAKSEILPGENPGDLKRLRGAIHKKLRPRNELETKLVEQVITGFWRMERGTRAEQSLLQSSGDFEETDWVGVMNGNYLEKIEKYETHAANMVERAFIALGRLRGVNYFEVDNLEVDNNAECKDE